MSGKTILLFAEGDKILKEYFPLVEALQQRGFTPIVLVASTCSKAWEQKLRECHIRMERWEDHERATTGASSKSRSDHQEVTVRGSWWSREWQHVRLFAGTLREYFRLRVIFQRIFDVLKPDLIILSGEGNLKRMVPLRAARERQIPSLIVPLFYPLRETLWLTYTDNEKVKDLYTNRSWINRLMIRILPTCSYRQKGITVLRDPGGEILATWLLGLLPHNPWTFGTGLGTRIAVWNQYEYDRITSAGVSPEKLRVTGKSQEDVLYQKFQGSVEERRHALGILPGKKVLLCAPPNYGEHGMLSWDRHWEEMRFLLETCQPLPNVQVLWTLYPGCDEAAYREFVKPYQVLIPIVHDVASLLPICDVYTTDITSSTVTLAVAAQKPVVVFNFISPHFRSALRDVKIGAIEVSQREQLRPALTSVFQDEAVFQTLKRQQELASGRLGQMDGQCNQRLIAQIEELTHMPLKDASHVTL